MSYSPISIILTLWAVPENPDQKSRKDGEPLLSLRSLHISAAHLELRSSLDRLGVLAFSYGSACRVPAKGLKVS